MIRRTNDSVPKKWDERERRDRDCKEKREVRRITHPGSFETVGWVGDECHRLIVDPMKLNPIAHPGKSRPPKKYRSVLLFRRKNHQPIATTIPT